MENISHIENERENMRLLLEKATVWAEGRSRIVLETGTPLNDRELTLAKEVGVSHPELVRILEVDELPVPSDTKLRSMAETTGLFGPDIAGLTFGHGIYILKGERTSRLVSHELRHVYQYEQAQSIHNFLLEYIPQLLSFGYANAPLETDARSHEHLGQ